MRVNVYAEELPPEGAIEIIAKEIEGQTFTGLRIPLYLPVTLPDGKQARGKFMHHPDDDDSSAITIWGKKGLRALLNEALTKLDAYYGYDCYAGFNEAQYMIALDKDSEASGGKSSEVVRGIVSRSGVFGCHGIINDADETYVSLDHITTGRRIGLFEDVESAIAVMRRLEPHAISFDCGKFGEDAKDALGKEKSKLLLTLST